MSQRRNGARKHQVLVAKIGLTILGTVLFSAGRTDAAERFAPPLAVPASGAWKAPAPEPARDQGAKTFRFLDGQEGLPR